LLLCCGSVLWKPSVRLATSGPLPAGLGLVLIRCALYGPIHVVCSLGPEACYACYTSLVNLYELIISDSLAIERSKKSELHTLVLLSGLPLCCGSVLWKPSVRLATSGPLPAGLGLVLIRCALYGPIHVRKYAMEILERAHMVGCNPSRTPIDTESKLWDGGTLVVNPSLYQSLAGSLQYLTFTRPDITYAMQQIAYSNADWAVCPTTRRSNSRCGVFRGNNLLSWSSKRQETLSRSSAEADYRDVANVVRILHVPSRFQYADIFTKGLPSALFDEFRDSLSVRCTPAPTAREY
nr:ribonuclease H-like domain-containing protein [Tanacetum cinerariifolium]